MKNATDIIMDFTRISSQPSKTHDGETSLNCCPGCDEQLAHAYAKYIMDLAHEHLPSRNVP